MRAYAMLRVASVLISVALALEPVFGRQERRRQHCALRNKFNSPHLIQNDGRLMTWSEALFQVAGHSFDNFVTQNLSNHLFQTPQFSFGLDLMSLNMHRGRDHGIGTYNGKQGGLWAQTCY
ncbi:hypothetical protein GWK47_024170 [Chionoecetes opilio]|uniref:Uncharacterized protein n=1 Tax=Chionoecetes opilio TaxID=41210 RepID=A0A8J4XVM8_CHIOP|nr:hypothetical protein GWK47_024170 [Chionoecetes opilio]